MKQKLLHCPTCEMKKPMIVVKRVYHWGCLAFLETGYQEAFYCPWCGKDYVESKKDLIEWSSK